MKVIETDAVKFKADAVQKLQGALFDTLAALEVANNPKVAALDKLIKAAEKDENLSDAVAALQAQKSAALVERRKAIGDAMVVAFGGTYGIAVAAEGAKRGRKATTKAAAAAVEVTDAQKAKVLEQVGAKDKGQKIIAQAAALDTAIVSAALRELETEGKVTRGGNKGRYPAYRLA